MFFQDVTKKGLVTNKSFWKFVRPFLTNKNYHEQSDIMLIYNAKVIVAEHDLIKTFNDYNINIYSRKFVLGKT